MCKSMQSVDLLLKLYLQNQVQNQILHPWSIQSLVWFPFFAAILRCSAHSQVLSADQTRACCGTCCAKTHERSSSSQQQNYYKPMRVSWKQHIGALVTHLRSATTMRQHLPYGLLQNWGNCTLHCVFRFHRTQNLWNERLCWIWFFYNSHPNRIRHNCTRQNTRSWLS